jgi:hypothetical protein
MIAFCGRFPWTGAAAKHPERAGRRRICLALAPAGVDAQTQAQVPSVEIPGVPSPLLFGAPLAIAPARQIVLGARWTF